MAVFRKAHSRAKPIVDSRTVTAGQTYDDGTMSYVASLCAPGGPPYHYYDLLLSEDEMMGLVSGWLEILSRRLREKQLVHLLQVRKP